MRDASGRIQTGRQTEGYLIRMRDRFRILMDDAGCDQERGKSFDGGREETLHPLAYQDAVFPGKGYYVCDRPQRGELYIVCEISPVPRQMQCSGHHESDAAACQLLVWIRAVLLVRIDHGDACRQLLRRRVMVGHDDIQPLGFPCDERSRTDPAVHRDEERIALFPEGKQSLLIQTISFRFSPGDVVSDIGAHAFQAAHEDRSRCDAVYIIVSVDYDLLSALDRGKQTGDAFLHPLHQERIGEI